MNQKLGSCLLVALLAVLCACASDSGAVAASAGMASSPQPPPVTAQAPAPASPKPANPCGFNPSDWCSSPPGDVCGTHHDAASCKADARCQGMHYRGESVAACHYDKRGFADNCPTVGCVSR